MYTAHFIKSWKSVPTIAVAERGKDDPIVQNGLSISPREMMDLTRQGFAIGAQNARMLQEVKSMAVGEVPLEFRRGFDMADGYQAQQSVRDKARQVRSKLMDGTFDNMLQPKTE